MGKRKQEEPTTQLPDWKVGDKVLWSGIPVTVTVLFPSGMIEVMNPTLRVIVESGYDLEKVPQ